MSYLKNKNVLVLGGSGFLGNSVIKLLLENRVYVHLFFSAGPTMVLRKHSSCIHEHHVDNFRHGLQWFARIVCHSFLGSGKWLHLLSVNGT